MPATPILNLPYPAPGDAPDGPAQIQALAEAIEAHGAFVVGEVRHVAVAAPPSGWLLCDGRAVSRATYAKLFAALGTVYGVGDGTTTFNLPDTRGRTLIGTGQGAGLTSRAAGAKPGAEKISVAAMPAHNHHLTGGVPSQPGGFGGGGGSYITGGTFITDTENTGGGAADGNMPPSLAIPAYIYAGA